MISSVEERQIRPCNSCVFFTIGPCSCGINIQGILKGRPCYFHHTPEEIVELIKLHNSGELPEWLKVELDKDIQFSQDNLKRSKDCKNKISDSNWITRINTVKWVLSLRKEDEKIV